MRDSQLDSCFYWNEFLTCNKKMASVYLTQSIQGGKFYHLYKTSSHQGPIFYSPNNYAFFLRRIQLLLSPMVDVLSYCLLPDSFHVVLYAKEVIVVKEEYVDHPEDIGHFISETWRKLFATYTVTIQKQEALPLEEIILDQNFYRFELESDDLVRQAICCVHQVPQYSGLVDTFGDFAYSSYAALSAGSRGLADRELVYTLFGDRTGFNDAHQWPASFNTLPLFSLQH